MTRREQRLVVAAFAAAMVAGIASAYVRLAAARESAASAARALADCERLARRIDAARGPAAPAGAPSVEVSTSGGGAAAESRDVRALEFVRRIDAAVRSAELPDDRIGRIVPGLPRRVGDSPFVETPTAVELRGVELRQLFAFLHALSSTGRDGRAVGLRDIRLTAPPGEQGGGMWSVDGTLTHTTYAPKEPLPPVR